ncbi:hypothetical protein BGW38_010688 [Lunasporangiospora selenospora]|uniref:MAPEG family protein n=1 Tax=Lunasporangiospora selenospora TaxID=979761 RepID=A0A9P6FVX1_9FUNG|nr:hypothetical protein BGW38_010688 [Lunasporangiospora selenospora]
MDVPLPLLKAPMPQSQPSSEPNNALTFTSFAGLATMAPAFYPPSRSTPPVSVFSEPTRTFEPLHSAVPSASTSSQEIPSVHTPSASSILSTETDKYKSAAETEEKLLTQSSTSLSSATTVSTTITKGTITRTTTSTGLDGTVTVLTEYPSTTRARNTTAVVSGGESLQTSLRFPVNPRGQLDKVEAKMTKAAWAMAKRAEGAHSNGLETLPIYFGAILAALYAGVPKETVTYYAKFFIGTRFLFNIIYIFNTNNITALARTGVWTASIAACVKLFLAAASMKY